MMERSEVKNVMKHTKPIRERDRQALTTHIKNIEMIDARLRKGFSQEQMADQIGTTQSTYSRIESGFIQKPDEEIVQRIADILEVPIDDLFVKENLESSPPRIQSEKALNPKDIPAMLRDLKGLLDDGIITDEEFRDKKRELLVRW
jgi:transcriptional regulator with XRE-family HTH domain